MAADGYPGTSPDETGCSERNITQRYQTQARLQPLDTSGNGAVEYLVGGCEGQSGGRVLKYTATGLAAYGIQTYGEHGGFSSTDRVTG